MSAFLLLLTALFITVKSDQNAFKSLGIELPKQLMGLQTAIYADYLYVFGGRNSSNGVYNTDFWRINLKDKLTLTDTNDDITSTLLSSDWELLSVIAPTYSDTALNSNEFVCDGQCSVVIDKYLYLVGPYNSLKTSGLNQNSQLIYRLDLSQNPPVFSAQSDFKSSAGYDARQQCVTSSKGKLYTTNGQFSPQTESIAEYDPSSDSSSVSAALSTTGRWNAGCGADKLGNIFVLGGRSKSSFFGTSTVDMFNIADGEWSVIGQNVPRSYTNCVNSAFSSNIECIGGWEVVGQNTATCVDSVVYTKETGPVSVSLATPVFSAGVENYVIDAGTIGGYGASVVLVIGGSNSGPNDSEFIGTDEIQYAVRYELKTAEPSAAPSPMPSAMTEEPSPTPSRSPLLPGQTFAPSPDPTTALPTTAPVESSAVRCAFDILCLLGFFVMLIL